MTWVGSKRRAACRVRGAVASVLVLAAVTACGGGGGTSSTSTSTRSVAIGATSLSGATGSTWVSTTTSTSSSESLPALVAKVQSGIIRIEANGCSTLDTGTGFLISPRLVATVEHVVDGATSIKLIRSGKTLAFGTVIGDDPERDVALVQASKPLSGYKFTFANTAPALGDSVAALGFPLGLPLSVSPGAVSGTSRTIPIDGIDRRELIQTDAPVNPGNSGGPLLSMDTGQVDGLIDLGTTQANGIAFAVSAQVARPLIEAWEVAPQTGPPQICQQTTTTATSTATSSASAPTTSGPIAAVDNYWNDIDAGDFADAWTYLAPGITPQSAFVAGENEVGVESAIFSGYLESRSATSAVIGVSSLQTIDHKYGCRTWTGTYQIVFGSDEWLIARADIVPSACK